MKNSSEKITPNAKLPDESGDENQNVPWVNKTTKDITSSIIEGENQEEDLFEQVQKHFLEGNLSEAEWRLEKLCDQFTKTKTKDTFKCLTNENEKGAMLHSMTGDIKELREKTGDAMIYYLNAHLLSPDNQKYFLKAQELINKSKEIKFYSCTKDQFDQMVDLVEQSGSKFDNLERQ